MHRPLLRASLRSLADCFCKSRLDSCHLEGVRNTGSSLEILRHIETSSGNDVCGHGKGLGSMSIQMQIVSALRLGDRNKASHLLSNLSNGNNSLRAADFVRILDYCAITPDPLFILETWRLMKEKGISFNDTCYLLMVRALSEGGHLDEALSFIEVIGESLGHYSALPLYNCFLRACAKRQSMKHVDLCLDLMDSRGVKKNEITYRELLKIAVLQQNISAVHIIWKDYIKYYSPSMLSMKLFIQSLSRLRDLKSAYKTLQDMIGLMQGWKFFPLDMNSKKRLYPAKLDILTPPCQSSSRNLHMNESKDAIALSMNISEKNQLSPLRTDEVSIMNIGVLNESDKRILESAFGNVMEACAQTQNGELAEQLMLQMENLRLQLSNHVYNCFVRAVAPKNDLEFNIGLLERMQQMNMKPYDSTLATLSVEYSKALDLDNAEAMLDQMTKCPKLFPFHEFFEACYTADQPQRVTKMLAKMKNLKLQPNIRTYELLFLLFTKVNSPYERGDKQSKGVSARRIKLLEKDMMKNSASHSHISIKNLLKDLGEEEMFREQIQRFQSAIKLFFHQDLNCEVAMFNAVICGFVEAEQPHIAINLFNTLKSYGLSPDAATYHMMIDAFSTLRNPTIARALLSLMMRSGFMPDVSTYTVYLKVLLEIPMFSDIPHLMHIMNLDGVQVDTLFYNTIFHKAWIKKRIDVIEFFIEKMRRQRILPDPTTCLHVFSCYVRCGHLGTAFAALQVLSLRMIGEDRASLISERSKYRKLILTEDSEPESKILQLFDSNVNLAAGLLNLRWCALLGYRMYWWPGRSKWAIRLKNAYRTNPWKKKKLSTWYDLSPEDRKRVNDEMSPEHRKRLDEKFKEKRKWRH